MNSCGFTMAITSIAIAIANNISDEELDLVSAAFTQLGDTLATISARRNFCNNKISNSNNKTLNSRSL